MRALLMHPDRDFNLQQQLPQQAQTLAQDLALDALLGAMAGDDKFLLDVARTALFAGLQSDVDTIVYRQEIMKDCLNNPAAVGQLYDLAVEAIERERRRYFGIFSHYPSAILGGAIELLEIFVGILRKLRELGDAEAERFTSRGFTALFRMLQTEFSEAYLASVQNHLRELRCRRGVLVSAELGKGNRGTNYVLRQARDNGPNWLQRALGRRPSKYTIRIAERDDTGAQTLSELRDRGINLAANALAQSGDHMLNFFRLLRVELGFYIGCLNLHERLVTRGIVMTFPRPETAGVRRHRFSDLRDVSLALTMERSVVSNTLDADGKSLVIITGANQGGKSSLLRSVGLAQMMMQCGMFVAAESFTAGLCAGLFTHYKREEDATMKSGKFDEELSRMSDIADRVGPNAMVLFNESFASTNEREGSEIAGQVIRALLERRIRVFFVTHLYELARGFFDRQTDDAIFLRAQRRADGTRTFRVVEGEPLETSYGEDLYREVFRVGSQELSAR